MMAIDVKRLGEAEPVVTSRVERAIDQLRAEKALDAKLLAAASVDVDGARWWYALRSIACSEIGLAEALVTSRVDAVVPVKKVPVKRRCAGGGRKVVHRPVLAGLVFVRLVPSVEAFAGLLRVRGVSALIGSGERPHPIGDREMNSFMDLAQAGAFDERNVPTGLQVGTWVRVNVGAMADMTGVFEGYARGRTARVRSWLFGHEMVVDVKLAHLEKLI